MTDEQSHTSDTHGDTRGRWWNKVTNRASRIKAKIMVQVGTVNGDVKINDAQADDAKAKTTRGRRRAVASRVVKVVAFLLPCLALFTFGEAFRLLLVFQYRNAVSLAGADWLKVIVSVFILWFVGSVWLTAMFFGKDFRDGTMIVRSVDKHGRRSSSAVEPRVQQQKRNFAVILVVALLILGLILGQRLTVLHPIASLFAH